MTDNYDEKSIADYEAYYWQHDPWAERAAKVGLGSVVTSGDLISDEEFVRTDFYQDWLARRVFYVLGSVFPIADGHLGALGIERPHASGRYRAEQKRFAEQLLPHLQRALQVRYRLNEAGIEQQGTLEALDRSRTVTIVTDGEGCVIYANRRAETLLSAGDAIRIVAGRLASAYRFGSDRLRPLLRSAVQTAAGRMGSAGGMLALERDGRLPLTIMVAPFRSAMNGIGAPEPAAILFIRDPEYP